MKSKHIAQVIIFIGLGIVMLLGLNYLLQPAWMEWNNYDTTRGFYEEPENTIETIFLGASTTVNGYIPMELYDNYGLCTYNLGTELQPMLASYYWLEEVNRLHGDSLKNVVLDVTMLRRVPQDAYYQKALDGMRLSDIKVQALSDFRQGSDDVLSYMFPLISYHSRWSSLEKSDFEKIYYEINHGTRGYNFVIDNLLEQKDASDIALPEYYVKNETSIAELNRESLYYLKKIMDLCTENNLKLVLVKTPGIGVWSDADHNAVERIAEENQLYFADFNYDPLYSQIGYNQASDSVDGYHLNYYGARKLTDWFGKFLVEECNGTDIHEDVRYAFMKQESAEYEIYISRVLKLRDSRNITDYLSAALNDENNTIFITVRDDAAGHLSEEQREYFNAVGLTELASIEFRDSYIGIIEDGRVAYEQVDHLNDHAEVLLNLEKVTMNELVDLSLERNEKETDLTISYSFVIGGETVVSLQSGGSYLGNISSCKIGDTEYSPARRGLNIVVYDRKRKKVLDQVVFDTCVESQGYSRNFEQELQTAEQEQTSFDELPEVLQELVQYNKKCEAKKQAVDSKSEVHDNIIDFLKEYFDRENTMIFLSAKDEAAAGIRESARKKLQRMNLLQLAEIDYMDSYIGIVIDGEVVYEKRDHGKQPITQKGIGYVLTSAGMESGNLSSIMIDGQEYSPAGRGINIVVYDTETERVICSVNFDTYEIVVE